MKKNTKALIAASKEIGLKVNAEKTKYANIYREQKAGQNHNIKIDDNFSERMEQFTHLRTTLKNQNSIQE